MIMEFSLASLWNKAKSRKKSFPGKNIKSASRLKQTNEWNSEKKNKQNKTKNHNNNIKNKVEHVHNMKNL